VKYPLEALSRWSIREDDFPHPLPIEAAIGADAVGSERFPKRIDGAAFRAGERVRDRVRVYYPGPQIAEHAGGSRLAAPDPASQTYDERHCRILPSAFSTGNRERKSLSSEVWRQAPGK
jgi:hypothetical protein